MCATRPQILSISFGKSMSFIDSFESGVDGADPGFQLTFIGRFEQIPVAEQKQVHFESVPLRGEDVLAGVESKEVCFSGVMADFFGAILNQA